MAGKKSKVPGQKHQPHPTKRPQQTEFPERQGPPWKWSFCMMDWEGPFGWQQCDNGKFKYILNKLSEREQLTYQQLREDGSHVVEVANFASIAQKRLTEIGKEELSELFSFALSGRERVFCVKDGATFALLWWDPGHAVYPSPKKHT